MRNKEEVNPNFNDYVKSVKNSRRTLVVENIAMVAEQAERTFITLNKVLLMFSTDRRFYLKKRQFVKEQLHEMIDRVFMEA